ncbi:hypothetical protein FI667_g2725, partial [Globisporangium splendens]
MTSQSIAERSRSSARGPQRSCAKAINHAERYGGAEIESDDVLTTAPITIASCRDSESHAGRADEHTVSPLSADHAKRSAPVNVRDQCIECSCCMSDGAMRIRSEEIIAAWLRHLDGHLHVQSAILLYARGTRRLRPMIQSSAAAS